MNRKITIKGLIALITAVAAVNLAGCKVMNTEPIVKKYFSLDVQRTSRDTAAGSASIEVRRFDIADMFAGTGLVYRKSDFNYESDYYNEFLAPPESIVTDTARTWLRRSALFAAVFDTGSVGNADYILEAEITELYIDCRQKQKPLAVARITFSLFEVKNGSKNMILQKEYEAEKQIESSRPSAAVAGLSDCLEQILKKLESDLAEKMKR